MGQNVNGLFHFLVSRLRDTIKRFSKAMIFLGIILGLGILSTWGISKLDTKFIEKIEEAQLNKK